MTHQLSTITSEIHRGLAGVVVDTTEISTVIQETNSLTYRGYPGQDLAARRSFEEVAYLLWYGELPEPGQLRGHEPGQVPDPAGQTGTSST